MTNTAYRKRADWQDAQARYMAGPEPGDSPVTHFAKVTKAIMDMYQIEMQYE